MATYTSSQAGDWNSATTWGGGGWPNTAGDVVNINHAVRYNINDDTTEIGIININANGKLYWDSDATTIRTLRMQAAKYINIYGGELELRAGAFIRLVPTSYIYMDNIANSVLDAVGTIPNYYTTVTSNTSIGDCKIFVSDPSGFGIGDWISIFDNTNHSWTNRQDEGAWVNYVGDDHILVRRWIGPSFTLNDTTNIGSNSWYCSGDVRAFYPGSKFVIGSEDFEVSSIDKYNQIIYTTTDSTSEYTIGTIGYESGMEVAHTTSEIVYKIATVLVTSSLSNASYIDVSSSGGWVENDVIGIGGNIYTEAEERIIQSITVGGGVGGSDRINLTTNLTYAHNINTLVAKFNRDIVIHGNTSDAISSTSGYVRILNGSASGRQVIFENVELKYIGTSSSYVYCGFILGCQNNPAGGHRVTNCSSHHGYKSGYCGALYGYYGYYTTWRNNVTFDVQYGVGQDANYYMSIFNYLNFGNGGNHSLSGYSGSWIKYFYNHSADGAISMPYNTVSSYAGATYASEWEYFISENCRRGFSKGAGHVRRVKAINVTTYSTFSSYWVQENGVFYNEAEFYGGLTPASSSYYNGSYYQDTQNPWNSITRVNNVDFIREKKLIVYYYGYGITDENIFRVSGRDSWKFYVQGNNSGYTPGFFAKVIGSYGRTIKVGAWVRKNSTFNGTRPLIEIRDSSKWTQLVVSQMTTANDAWEYISVSYTCTKNINLSIRVIAYGNAGNFWVSEPTLDPDGCYYYTGCMQEDWRIGNPYSSGIRLSGVRL